jgi:CDGSH-type Zn-finger protein/ferredoxin
MSKKQTSEGEKITVFFDPQRCIHTGNCVRGLPAVFRAGAKGAWIFPDEADADALAALIETCPSGALTYDLKNGLTEKKPDQNIITVAENGPITVVADFTLNDEKQDSYRAVFCRCGASQNKPWCDGAHKQAGFTDAGNVQVFNPDAELASGALKIKTIKNGPLFLEGPHRICNASGETARTDDRSGMCRCGASRNKPFCDGSHAEIGFQAD